MRKWLSEHSLAVVLIIIFLAIFAGQGVAGFKQYNEELETHHARQLSVPEYLRSGSFMEATFENWESEFLQMGAYVILTVFLRQKGSAESKKLEGNEPVDQNPKATRNPDTPRPVRHGGWVLKIYEHSLSLAFIVLFLMSFGLHAYGGAREACVLDSLHGEACQSTVQFMTTADFWYQSLQNWQSEFLAVFAIVVLSVYLREKGSPESKPVSAPNHLTGSE
jgi:hypothetical protein